MNPLEVLRRPVLSEKSNKLRESAGKFMFEVAMNATKEDIVKAIETVYQVKVTKVQTLIKPTKTRRKGYHLSKTSKIKRAMITLVEGAKIPVFEDQ